MRHNAVVEEDHRNVVVVEEHRIELFAVEVVLVGKDFHLRQSRRSFETQGLEDKHRKIVVVAVEVVADKDFHKVVEDFVGKGYRVVVVVVDMGYRVDCMDCLVVVEVEGMGYYREMEQEDIHQLGGSHHHRVAVVEEGMHLYHAEMRVLEGIQDYHSHQDDLLVEGEESCNHHKQVVQQQVFPNA